MQNLKKEKEGRINTGKTVGQHHKMTLRKVSCTLFIINFMTIILNSLSGVTDNYLSMFH